MGLSWEVLEASLMIEGMGQGNQGSPCFLLSVSDLKDGAQALIWKKLAPAILMKEREWGFESWGCRQSCIQSEGLQAIQWFPRACPWDFREGGLHDEG